MSNIRLPAVSGSFYPEKTQELSLAISNLLEGCHPPINKALFNQPKALIVPHAGLIYSGSIAANAFQLLLPFKHQIKRVVLIGPAHRVWIQGAAISSKKYFNTPLGNVSIEDFTSEKLIANSNISISDEAHAFEHSIEVQLPFLQCVLDNFELLPIVIGELTIDAAAEIIDGFIMEPETLTIVSSDLSHFHDYETAKSIDNRTCQLIENYQYQTINHEMACGSTAIQGLLKSAKNNSLAIQKIAQCNSGDTAGDRNRVVGYVSYAIF